MANAPIGNNILEGVLGVVHIRFNAVDMGKTLDATELALEEDYKEIMYAEDGTKSADEVRTGTAYFLRCTFAQITTARLKEMIEGLRVSGSGNSGVFGRSHYQSRKDNESHPLIVRRVDSEGAEYVNEFFTLHFDKASVKITSPINWGADVQRTVQAEFRIWWNEAESRYGYFGNATSAAA